MASEKISQLPTVANALAADLIYAVQGGVSVQETLQQVLNLGLANTILNFNANPNGNVAGKTYQLCWDTVNDALYVCTTTGSTTTAVWTEITTGVTLTGQTGTGAFVGSTTPTITTPILSGPTLTNASSTTELKFTNTTLGVSGTTTNNNAAAGITGEFKSSVVLAGSAVTLTTLTAANVTSMSLTAGDWDVYGNVFFSNASDVLNQVICWCSTTSAVAPDNALQSRLSNGSGELTLDIGLNTPYLRLSLASTTTVYLSAYAVFGSGTTTACGGIYARRAR
jgi:hypothetical protein